MLAIKTWELKKETTKTLHNTSYRNKPMKCEVLQLE